MSSFSEIVKKEWGEELNIKIYCDKEKVHVQGVSAKAIWNNKELEIVIGIELALFVDIFTQYFVSKKYLPSIFRTNKQEAENYLQLHIQNLLLRSICWHEFFHIEREHNSFENVDNKYKELDADQYTAYAVVYDTQRGIDRIPEISELDIIKSIFMAFVEFYCTLYISYPTLNSTHPDWLTRLIVFEKCFMHAIFNGKNPKKINGTLFNIEPKHIKEICEIILQETLVRKSLKDDFDKINVNDIVPDDFDHFLKKM